MIRCPQCSQLIDVDPDSKTAIKCPACRADVKPSEAMAAITAKPLPLPAEAEGAEADDPAIDIGSDRWSSARNGYRLVFGSILAMTLLSFISQTGATYLVATLGQQAVRDAARPDAVDPNPAVRSFMIVNGTASCLAPIAGLVTFIGMIFVCFAPDATTRTRALLTLMTFGLFTGTAIVLGIYFAVIVTQELGPAAGQLMGDADALVRFMLERTDGKVGLAILVALLIVAAILWTLTHAAVGRAVNDAGLVKATHLYLACMIVIQSASSMGSILTSIYVDTLGDGSPVVVASMAFSVVATLGLNVWYLNLCRRTIRAISPA